MRRERRRWIAVSAFAFLALPAGVSAQVLDAASDAARSEPTEVFESVPGLTPVVALRTPLGAGTPADLWALPPTADGGTSRRTKVILGAVLGGVAGTVVGEYWFGRGLDMPHGLDMLLGAGLGAGIGALIGLIVDGASSNDPVTLSVMPHVLDGGASARITVPVR